MALVYPASNGCTNVLLIDRAVKDYQVFVDAVNPATLPIVYSSSSSKEELLDVLRSNFTTISRIGLAFEIPALLDNAPFNGEQNTAFLKSVIATFSVKNIDYLACNTLLFPEWQAYFAEIATTGVVVGASDNSTGNLKYGGDWVMESTGQDIETIYFTEKIEFYRFLLGGGGLHSFVIGNDNNLYATGYNTSGQLGLGDVANRLSFTKIDLSGVVAVSCGYTFSLAVKSDGTLWATGYNIVGQLGTGDNTNRSSFTKVFLPGGPVKAVACGIGHSLAVKADGTLWATGYNQYGQLGFGSNSDKNVFIATSLFYINAVACGAYCSFAIDYDGNLWATGFNSAGQLGTRDKTNRNSFVKVLSDVKAVSCGEAHTFVIKTDGSLWATGDNQYGQLGDGTTISRSSFARVRDLAFGQDSDLTDVEAVSCNAYHSLILRSGRTVWAAGYNGDRLFGDGGAVPNRNYFAPVQGLSNIVAITSGIFHALALKGDGTLWAVGRNQSGQLGDGTTGDRNYYLPVTATIRSLFDSTVVQFQLPRLPASTFDGIAVIPQIGGVDISLNYNSSLTYTVDVYTYSTGYYSGGNGLFSGYLWKFAPPIYVADPKFVNVACSIDLATSPIVIRGLTSDITYYFVVSARKRDEELYYPNTITSRTTAAMLNKMPPSNFLKGVPLSYFIGNGLNLSSGNGSITMYPGTSVNNDQYALYVSIAGGAGGNGGSIPVTNYDPYRDPKYIVQTPISGGAGGNGGRGNFIYMGAVFGKQTLEYTVGGGGLNGESDSGMYSGLDGGRLIYSYTNVATPKRAFAGSSGTKTQIAISSGTITALGGGGGEVASLALLPNNDYWGTIVPAKNSMNGTVTPSGDFQQLADEPAFGLAPGGNGNIVIKTSLLRTSASGGSQTFNIPAGKTVVVTLFCQSNRTRNVLSQTTFSGGAIMFSYTYSANGTLILTNKDGNSNCSATMGSTSVTTLQRYNVLPVAAAITGTVTQIWTLRPRIPYYDNIVYNLDSTPNTGGYWEFSVWDSATNAQ